MRDGIVAPLRSQHGLIGAILVADRLSEVSTFDESDLRLFGTLANHAAVALDNGRLVQQLRQEAAEREHEALHDALTELPNRTLFGQRLREAITNAGGSKRMAVMIMDLDRFKDVNDTLGHHTGDLLLRTVAARLAGLDLAGATIARLGGDEFAVLLAVGALEHEAEEAARRIWKTVIEPVVLDDVRLEVDASIGIALWPEHGSNPTALLQKADVAMYAAKGRQSGVAVYDSQLDTHSPRRLSLAGELRQAVDAGELVVFHQPKVRLSDATVVGTEALVRWNHPVHGLVPPDEFIPLAETTGAIQALTTYVLERAIDRCARWRALQYDLSVAVNLAVRSLQDPGLAAVVADLLDRARLPAQCLTLEITESTIMDDDKRILPVLHDLADLGVRLSIDDFGTGYSSLSYLQRLPVHELKIDKSFVLSLATNHNDIKIVRSIVELAHGLDLEVVAEGVENGASWDRLRLMGCDLAQGYHLSRPLSEEALLGWLASGRMQPAPAPV